MGDAVATLGTKAMDAASSRRTLRNIQNSSPEKIKQAIRANDELVDSFIALGLSRTAQGE